MRIAVIVVVALGACGGAGRPPPARPLSAQQHLAEAERHEQIAAEHRRQALYMEEGRAAPTITCYDRPLAGVPYSGTEPIQVMKPCWRTDELEAHRQAARHNLEEAAAHRRAARELYAAERSTCAGLGEEEISHGPFWHVDDVVRVDRLAENGELRGARVVFHTVSGLTVAWLRQAVSCEQARAAVVGYSDTFLPYSPLALPGVGTRVVEVADGIEVAIRSTDPLTAATILGRAQALLDQSPHTL